MPQRRSVAALFRPASARRWRDAAQSLSDLASPPLVHVDSPSRRPGWREGLHRAKTVGDFLVERLRAWGVQRVFGYPGDGINGAVAAFEHAGDEGRASSRRAMRAVRVHGRSACQVHRRARGVSGHSRPRGDPPPQRVVRRRNGPPARLSHDLRVRVVLCAESSGEEIRLHSEPEAESSQRDSDCHHSPTLWSGLIPCCPKTHDSEQLAEHHPDNEHGRTQPQSGSPLQKAAWAPHPGVSADST